MTPERQNETWEYLPNHIRRELQRDYIKVLEAQKLDPRNDRIDAHYMFLLKYFGQHNLTAQAEDRPNEPLCSVDSQNYNNRNHIVGRENNINYAQYRLDLAKELAVVMLEKDWPLRMMQLTLPTRLSNNLKKPRYDYYKNFL